MTHKKKWFKKKWKVFYLNNKELMAYTLLGTFDGEEQATKELLAYNQNVSVDDIEVRIEER